MIFARHLPDVEGLLGRVRQEAEHHDDGVGVGKTKRVDVSEKGRKNTKQHVRFENVRTERGQVKHSLNLKQKSGLGLKDIRNSFTEAGK